MEIYLPANCNEIGQRDSNEDTIYPHIATVKSRLFMVCDGVGGQAKGELASNMVCEGIASYLDNNPLEGVGDEAYWSASLRFVENQFLEHFKEFPESKGMASTLSLFRISNKERRVLIAWIGDSRVYHIRDGKIQYRTKDHSIVEALLEMDEITPQEAKDHPKRHIITRAINGTNPSKIDIKIIAEVRKDDFFLLCSDGILENLDEEKIQRWFTKDVSVEDLKQNIMTCVKGNTKDNYSMYIIKIKKI